MTRAGDWLAAAIERLEEGGVEAPHPSAHLILEEAAGLDRAGAAAHPERELSPLERSLAEDLLARRMRHEPVAYILGKRSFRDLDRDGRPQARSFDLSLRLLAEERYEDNLFADISTLAHVHHGLGPLSELLKAPELHHRLLYGSDYPLPALRFMLSPSKLQLGGLLDSEDRRMYVLGFELSIACEGCRACQQCSNCSQVLANAAANVRLSV